MKTVERPISLRSNTTLPQAKQSPKTKDQLQKVWARMKQKIQAPKQPRFMPPKKINHYSPPKLQINGEAIPKTIWGTAYKTVNLANRP